MCLLVYIKKDIYFVIYIRITCCICQMQCVDIMNNYDFSSFLLASLLDYMDYQGFWINLD